MAQHDQVVDSQGPLPVAQNPGWDEDQRIVFTHKSAHDPDPDITDIRDKQDETRKDRDISTDPPQLLGRGHWVKRMTQRMKIVAFSVEDEIDYYLNKHRNEYNEQDKMTDPIVYKASSNPDILYYHQAMQAHDKDEFKQAVIDEVNAHIKGNHWELIQNEDVPEGTKIIDSVWAMRRKRDIKTREVYKHKARLNLHGGQQIQGVHYQ